MTDFIAINGGDGEGGGQILRSALALSVVTGRAFRIQNIRAARPKPGLLRQHLTAVHAAAAVSGARVAGAELGASELRFEPGAIRGGALELAVGTAGSTALVWQTILPPLLRAGVSSRVVLEGGTHNPFAPPFDFLERTFVPALRQMGANLSLSLDAHGFYPAGGGKVTAQIEPSVLRPVSIVTRGDVVVTARAIVSGLPGHIAKRELAIVRERLGLEREQTQVVSVPVPAGPGNMLAVGVTSEGLCEVFSGFGAKGLTAEQLAAEVCDDVERYLAAGVPVGPHLADQLLVPMVLAGGGVFRTVTPSGHTLTNVDVIRRFVDLPITIEAESATVSKITVGSVEGRSS